MSDVIPKIPVKYNFEILQGTDYTFQFQIQNYDASRFDLRSYRIKMQVKKGYTGAVIDEFDSSEGTLTRSSSSNDEIQDLVTVQFKHVNTAEYPPGVLLYDVRLTSGGALMTKVLEGQIRCLANVTQ